MMKFKFKITKFKAILLASLLALIVSGIAGYLRYASVTRIALVNYPEYMLAPLLDQELNPFIDVDVIQWNESSGDELRNYDMVIFFGMGLHFTERQQQIIAESRVPVLTIAATRSETALNTLSEEDSAIIMRYLSYGGKENFRRMLEYVRYKIDGKRIFASMPAVPEEQEVYSFFHPAVENGFKTFAEYRQWYQDSGRFKANGAVVCILSGNGGGDLEALVEALEARNINVIAAHGMWQVMPEIESIKPDLIIYQPHGRLGDEAVNYLREHNIPLFCPIKVNMSYEDYLRDMQGMSGGMLSQSITMPELDGGAVPFVLSALFRDQNGLLTFQAIPDRLNRFADLVKKTTDLRRKPNSEKKIAIIYYGSIGRESATAGLGVAQSILNTLRRLQSEGYNTGVLPERVEELDREIRAATAAYNTSAGRESGSVAPYIQRIAITPADYADWIFRSMPESLYRDVVSRYGEFPGRHYVTAEGDLQLGCIRFGNIILMPQSLPGEGDDDSTLIHGAKMAPPHSYIATYLYLRYGFEADALIHFGTHGSLEFTPQKQVALSSFDWPDVLIGEMPHFYIYIINNIGEAQIAKRRTYATIISHLTPPYMNAGSHGAVAELHEKMHWYETAENAMLKAEYARSIIEIAKREYYDRDLQLSESFSAGILTPEDFARLHNYLHEIESAKVNRGVYIIGRPYSEQEANETARLMTEDLVANELFDADLAAGKVTEDQRQDAHFFENNYLVPARRMIDEALAHPERFRAPDTAAPAGEDISPVEIAIRVKADLLRCTEAELAALINALNGGYTPAVPGGDPILNPATVPTGKNLYGIDPERTPTRESFAVGCQLAQSLIDLTLQREGRYPQKVAFSLWGGEFIRTQGTNIGQIFYLLGCEPVWDSRGRVRDVRLIPLAQLGRPRIDVVIQTSGQFRGAAASRMALIDKAVRLAAEDSDTTFENHVRNGSLAMTRMLIDSGMSAQDAKALSYVRIFGGVNGNFGTGIMGQVQDSGNWEDSSVIADNYILNMGAVYTAGHWGESMPQAFRLALHDVDAVVQSRSSSSWGPLSLDHVAEFTGGMSMAAREVNGRDPAAYFNDLRTPGRPRIQEAGEAAMSEAHSTVLNPAYIRAMMSDGAAATGTFQEVVRNTFSWEVMKPDMLEDHLWQSYKEVYIDDKYNLGIRAFFEENNPAALYYMSGVMLESIRKGFWRADEATIRQLARLHVELSMRHDLAPVDNPALQEMIRQHLSDPALQNHYAASIQRAAARDAESTADTQVQGQRLREDVVDENTPQGSHRGALIVIGVIIFCALLAVVIGNLRRRKR
ncbi:MAG: cobaltochelatase subunit CobN [Lentisphaerae bacterium]|nr:cobaltochelatase subunit CobN [Lentisphaerota bacterium]